MMESKSVLRMCAIYIVILFIPLQGLAKTEGVTCHLEWATMRDGVSLATEVYLPHNGEEPVAKLPVVLTRSPYNNWLGYPEFPSSNCDSKPLKTLASRGYAVLNQDVRGTARSEGKMNAIHQEANDGYDAVEWAAIQPWSNGKVGLSGASYVGLTALQAATAQPPHLVAVNAAITASDYHDNWTYVNGAFDLWFAQSWLLNSFARDAYRRQLESSGLSAEEVKEKVIQWLEIGNKSILNDWSWQLPLKNFSKFQQLAYYYDSWLDHPSYDQFWSSVDLEKQYSRINVPVLNSGGWYDIFAVGTVRNFTGLQKQGATELVREGSRLYMSPICHAPSCGPIKYTSDDFSMHGDTDLVNRWWDYWLKGIDNGIAGELAVEVFVMKPPDRGTEGSGFWLAADEFPLPGTVPGKYYLGSGGKANTRLGDGVLVTEIPAEETADQFTYDPHNPVPTLGGNLCCGGLLPPGAFDQSEIELRDDVLVYTSQPLIEDTTVVGSVKLNFWAISSAPDTDFTAKLVDVHHDGFAQNILDRVVRARYRNGSKTPPSLIEPGKAYRYKLDLGPTAIVFRKGHRIRLEISSSNFPHYDRNTNTGNLIASDSEVRVAKQTILHGAKYTSYLELPILSQSSIEQYRVNDPGAR